MRISAQKETFLPSVDQVQSAQAKFSIRDPPIDRVVWTAAYHLRSPSPPLFPFDSVRKQAEFLGQVEVAFVYNQSTGRQQKPSSTGSNLRASCRALCVARRVVEDVLIPEARDKEISRQRLDIYVLCRPYEMKGPSLLIERKVSAHAAKLISLPKSNPAKSALLRGFNVNTQVSPLGATVAVSRERLKPNESRLPIEDPPWI